MAKDIQSNIDLNIKSNINEQVDQLKGLTNEMQAYMRANRMWENAYAEDLRNLDAEIQKIKESVNNFYDTQNKLKEFNFSDEILHEFSTLYTEVTKLTDASNSLDTAIEKVKNLFSSFQQSENVINATADSVNKLISNFNNYDDNIIDILLNQLDQLKTASASMGLKEITNALDGLFSELNKITSIDLSKSTEEIKEQVEAFKSIDFSHGGGMKELQKLSPFNIESIKTTVEDIEKAFNDPLDVVFYKFKNLEDAFKNLSKTSYAESEKIKQSNEAFVELGKGLDANAIKQAEDNLKLYTQAVKELISNGEMSEDTLKKLAESFGEVYVGSKKSEEQIRLINEAMKEWHETGSVSQKTLQNVAHSFGQQTQQEQEAAEKTDLYEKSLAELIKTGKLSEGTLQNLIKSFGATAGEAALIVAAITAVIAILKKLNDIIDETVEMVETITKTIGKGALDGLKAMFSFAESGIENIMSGIEGLVDGVKELTSAVRDALDQLRDFADIGVEIQDAYYNMYTLIGTEASRNVSEFVDRLSDLYSLDSTPIIKSMKDIIASTASMGASVEDTTRAVKNLTIMSQDLSILAGSFERAEQDIANAITKGYIGRASTLYLLMTKQEIQNVRDLNSETARYNYLISISGRIKQRYANYLKTEAGQVAILNNQYKTLVNNISTLALKLYAMVAKPLTAILRIANAILETLIKLFNIKLDNFEDMPSISDSIADSLENMKDKAKEAERQLASFDDVIQLDKDKDTDIGAGITVDDVDLWKELLEVQKKEETELDRIIKWVKILIKLGKYFKAGKLIAKYFSNVLNSIKWNEIIQKAKEAAKAISEFLNGFIETPELWKNIGSTFGNAINTALTFLNDFAKNLNWKQLGKDLVASWNSFWNTYDSDLAGETLYNWFMSIVDFASGLISGKGFTNFAINIANTIATAIESLTSEDINQIVNNIFKLINDVLNGVSAFIDRLTEPEVRQKITTLITKVMASLKNNAPGWGTSLGNTLYDVFILALDSLEAWLAGGGFTALGKFIGNTITGFFNNLKEDIYDEEGNLIEEGDITRFANLIINFIDNAIQTAGDLLEQLEENGVLEKLKDFFTKLFTGLSEKSEDWGETLNEIITSLLEFAISILDTDKIRQTISNFLEGLDLGSIIGPWLEFQLKWFIETKLPMLLEKIDILGTLIEWLRNPITSLIKWLIDKGILEFQLGFPENENEIGLFDLLLNLVLGIPKRLAAWLINAFAGETESDIEGWLTFEKVLRFLSNLLTDPFTKLATNLGELIIKAIKSALTNAFSGFDLNKALSGITSGIGSKISGAISGALNKKSTYSISVEPSEAFKIPVQIPKLAKGGIAKQATLAMVGEAGKEAVLPLQNNTEWMNTLADKIASKLNTPSTQNRQPLTINLSAINQPVYTRSQMLEMGEIFANALQVYGANVSIV